MTSFRRGSLLVASVLSVSALTFTVAAQVTGGRTELKRADLSGADPMEVITALQETKPGEEIPRHYHHGTEAGYVVQGAMIQAPGKEPILLATGSSFMWPRGVPHAGFKVVGETSLKLFTTHIVDKGKSLSEQVKE